MFLWYIPRLLIHQNMFNYISTNKFSKRLKISYEIFQQKYIFQRKNVFVVVFVHLVNDLAIYCRLDDSNSLWITYQIIFEYSQEERSGSILKNPVQLNNYVYSIIKLFFIKIAVIRVSLLCVIIIIIDRRDFSQDIFCIYTEIIGL